MQRIILISLYSPSGNRFLSYQGYIRILLAYALLLLGKSPINIGIHISAIHTDILDTLHLKVCAPYR